MPSAFFQMLCLGWTSNGRAQYPVPLMSPVSIKERKSASIDVEHLVFYNKIIIYTT